MKNIKFLFTAILMMVATCTQAQTIQIMKYGQVIKEYQANQVDSIVYKPAQKVDGNVYYYWYGPTSRKPTSVSEMSTTSSVITEIDIIDGASMFIYPKIWGDIANYVDPDSGLGFGSVGDEDYVEGFLGTSGFKSIAIPSSAAQSLAGKTCKIRYYNYH